MVSKTEPSERSKRVNVLIFSFASACNLRTFEMQKEFEITQIALFLAVFPPKKHYYALDVGVTT